MRKIENIRSGAYLPAVNKEVLILGYNPQFWQFVFLGIAPVLLIGGYFDVIWIAGILYFVLILFLVYKGIVNERELEKGKKFFQEEKAYFERHREKEKIVFEVWDVLF